MFKIKVFIEFGSEWIKTRERNEALDIFVYNRAAAHVVGLDRYNEDQWNTFKKKNKLTQAPEEKKEIKLIRKKPSSFW